MYYFNRACTKINDIIMYLFHEYVSLDGYWLNDFHDMIQSTNARTNSKQCLDFVKKMRIHQPNAAECCEYLFHY